MNETAKKIIRPPIVVVMGHVDHGKTTLLDRIRQTNLAPDGSSPSRLTRFRATVESESGGITQHIGAYEILHNGKRLTFLDTPGHQAFSQMRARGAKVADVAILVVAADEGVKPQTKEAISHILESKTPMVVALNKIDRPAADPQRVKQELASANVLVEGWGGNVPVAEISAKTGQGVDALLELLLLVAEIENLAADPSAAAEGIVIESQLDHQRGPVATLLVQNGTLKKGEAVLAGSALARIKLLENFEAKPVEQAGPATPVQVMGWESLPQIGDTFRAGAEDELRALSQELHQISKVSARRNGDLVLIVKADVAGSLEALEGSIRNLPSRDIEIVILASGVGEITESDAKLAYASGALTLGFRARLSREAEGFIKQFPCRILRRDIIYELLEELQKEIERISAAKATAALRGRLEVLAVFGTKGSRQVIGGKVIEGALQKRMTVKILRQNIEIGQAKIFNLQKDKRDTDKIEAGDECGILLESPINVAKGDLLVEVKDGAA